MKKLVYIILAATMLCSLTSCYEMMGLYDDYPPYEHYHNPGPPPSHHMR